MFAVGDIGRGAALTAGLVPFVAAADDHCRDLGRARSFGTCGELLQGYAGNHHFLVTLPLRLSTHVSVRLTADSRVSVRPATKIKARAAAELLLRRLTDLGRCPAGTGADLDIRSEIPEGKGLASSSADIVATCRAIAQVAAVELLPWEISSIAALIEPTDGVMYEDVVVYDHLNCVLLDRLGAPPAMILVVVDPGGEVVTMDMRRLPYTLSEQLIIRAAYAHLVRAMGRGDVRGLGRAATASSLVNQRRHFKAEVPWLVRNRGRLQAAGVLVAHSGVVSGLLFEHWLEREAELAAEELQQRCPEANVSLQRTGPEAGEGVSQVLRERSLNGREALRQRPLRSHV